MEKRGPGRPPRRRSAFDQLPARVRRQILHMRAGDLVLCCHVHHKSTGSTAKDYHYEPTGRPISTKTAEMVIASGFLVAHEDGLLPGHSQTWKAK